MSEELKPQAQNNAEATTNAQAKPAAEVRAQFSHQQCLRQPH